VVDFTMTQSLDMLLQMYGRLLRLSKTDKPKTAFQVKLPQKDKKSLLMMAKNKQITNKRIPRAPKQTTDNT
jgi:superfamily II DNA or RNA helicase